MHFWGTLLRLDALTVDSSNGAIFALAHRRLAFGVTDWLKQGVINRYLRVRSGVNLHWDLCNSFHKCHIQENLRHYDSHPR